MYEASFVIVATLAAYRKEPYSEQKRKRGGNDEGNRMTLDDGYATITKVQGDAYSVTVVRKESPRTGRSQGSRRKLLRDWQLWQQINTTASLLNRPQHHSS